MIKSEILEGLGAILVLLLIGCLFALVVVGFWKMFHATEIIDAFRWAVVLIVLAIGASNTQRGSR